MSAADDDLVLLAEQALQARDYTRAETLYSQAISLDPRNALLYVGRAEVRQGRKQASLALQDLASAIAIEPDHAAWIFDRGSLHFVDGRFTAAIEDFTRAIEVATRTRDPFRVFEVSEEPLAAEELTKNLTADLYLARGRAYNEISCYGQAVIDFTQALTFQPSHINLLPPHYQVDGASLMVSYKTSMLRRVVALVLSFLNHKKPSIEGS